MLNEFSICCIKPLNVGRRVDVLSDFGDQVTATRVVNKVEHAQRNAKPELDLFCELLLSQECPFFLVSKVVPFLLFFFDLFCLFVDKVAELRSLLLFGHKLLASHVLHLVETLLGHILSMLLLGSVVGVFGPTTATSSLLCGLPCHFHKCVFVSCSKLVVQIVGVNSGLSILFVLTFQAWRSVHGREEVLIDDVSALIHLLLG